MFPHFTKFALNVFNDILSMHLFDETQDVLIGPSEILKSFAPSRIQSLMYPSVCPMKIQHFSINHNIYGYSYCSVIDGGGYKLSQIYM